LPKELQTSIQQLMAKNSVEMAEMLADFLQQVKEGSHTGGGILGRAAELLVAQRGIEN
jgi:hypothetical protein